MSNYQVLDEVQTKLDEIDRRYKELMRRRLTTIAATIALILSLGGIGALLWYIWGLG